MLKLCTPAASQMTVISPSTSSQCSIRPFVFPLLEQATICYVIFSSTSCFSANGGVGFPTFVVGRHSISVNAESRSSTCCQERYHLYSNYNVTSKWGGLFPGVVALHITSLNSSRGRHGQIWVSKHFADSMHGRQEWLLIVWIAPLLHKSLITMHKQALSGKLQPPSDCIYMSVYR